MNILPKKRWHVRSKDNISRVRKDEAKAEEIKLKLQNQQKTAESEARVNFLRKQKGIPETKSSNEKESQQNHLNLDSNFNSHIKVANAEHEIEKKAEKEKYEKQIGYLTYLGQDTNEALKLKSWYEVLPERKVLNSKAEEKDLKNKHKYDPLPLINSLLPIKDTCSLSSITRTGIKSSSTPKSIDIINKSNADVDDFSTGSQRIGKRQHAKRSKEKVKHTLYKSNSTDSDEILIEKRSKLEILRRERIKRELLEKERQAELLKSKICCSKSEPTKLNLNTSRINQKYNSQYNPQIAKQNMN